MKNKVAVISLGCDKNRVDTEKMLFLLEQAGYEFTQICEDADVLLVNTCGFIEKAKQESIEAIFEMAKYKNLGKQKKLVVTGCLSQRYGKDLFVDIQEIDAVIGVEREQDIVKIVADLVDKSRIIKTNRQQNEFSCGRVITTPNHYGYLKIADGCNNSCSYCAIPQIKGAYRSYEIDSLIEEANNLIGKGVREIILVAQDITLYGTDIYGKPMLKELLMELIKLPLWKVRLMYVYPERVDRELIEMISKNDKIAKYIDIPLQHIDDFILNRMNRQTSSNNIKKLLQMIKQVDKDIAVRSTFIVGFNSESRKRFRALAQFLRNNKEIDYAGFFGYSIEEGTKASKFEKGNIGKSIIKKRVRTLEKLWSKKIVAQNKRFIGKKIEVVYEGIDFDKQMFWGRMEQHAPEIDSKVYFTSDIPLDIGNIYNAEIVDSGFYLYGKVRKL